MARAFGGRTPARLAGGYLIQAALYLFVLSVNTTVLIARGLAAAPGELPIWGPLMVVTTVAAVALMANVSGRAGQN